MKITRTASREEWLAERLDLLAKEKAASRQLAALAEQRRALPAVAIDKERTMCSRAPTARWR
jgi:predicted dithiol-disulfide oxidoreductase (DUF899 family)